MALYQFDIALEHTDRGISQSLNLRTARHPSETAERVWLRALAYAWHWRERLEFGPGLSDPDAPDIVCKDYTGDTLAWIRVGKADPIKMQRVADQHPHAEVAVLFESPEKMQAFKAAGVELKRMDRIGIAAVDPALVTQLAAGDERRFKLSLTVAGDHFYVERGGQSFDGALTRG